MLDGEHVRLSNGRSGYMSQIEREATERCVRSAIAIRHDSTALFPAKWSNHDLSFSRLPAGAPFWVGRIIVTDPVRSNSATEIERRVTDKTKHL